MRRPPMAMNAANMVRATERSLGYVKEALRRAEDIGQDARKKERLAKQECKACFYFPRMGGAAITSQLCMCCGEDQMYGSTNTDVLCKPCAEEHRLCKHCGGDLEMKTRRRNWPGKPE